MGFKGCYACGQEGHMKVDCPKLKGEVSVRSNPTPVAASVAAPRPSEASGQTPMRGGRGRGKGRGSGAPTHTSGGPARVFALSQQDAQASNIVVVGTITINSHKAHVLFDSGSTHSYISPKFASRLNVMHEKLREPLVVSIPSGGELEVNKSYKVL